MEQAPTCFYSSLRLFLIFLLRCRRYNPGSVLVVLLLKRERERIAQHSLSALFWGGGEGVRGDFSCVVPWCKVAPGRGTVCLSFLMADVDFLGRPHGCACRMKTGLFSTFCPSLATLIGRHCASLPCLSQSALCIAPLSLSVGTVHRSLRSSVGTVHHSLVSLCPPQSEIRSDVWRCSGLVHECSKRLASS